MKAHSEDGRIVIELDDDDDDEICIELVIRRKEEEPVVYEPLRRPPRKYDFDKEYRVYRNSPKKRRLQKRMGINEHDIGPRFYRADEVMRWWIYGERS